LHREIEIFAEQQGITNFYKGEGICHQILPEKGHVQPGRLVVGADSHSCTYGAFSAMGVGMGSTDIAVAWATGQTWMRVPETINIQFEGELNSNNFTTTKDVVLSIIDKLRADGGTQKVLEYTGDFAETASIANRMTLANMSVECGATTGLFPSNHITREWLNQRGITDMQELSNSADAEYCREEVFNLDELEPQIACPNEIDNIKGISSVEGTEVTQVVIGSCTNGRIEDFRQVNELINGRRFKIKTMIVPASATIFQQAMKEGIIENFIDAGAILGNPGCGPCLGRQGGVLGDDDVCFSTTSRNYKGRMGSPKAEIYLGSPYVAAATALTGKITNPIEVM